jgi:hypothetical protein
MAQIENLPLVLTGLGLTASILYYAMVLRNANKTRELQLKAQELTAETRQIQLFTHYYDKIWDKDVQEVYFEVYPNFNTVDEYMEKFNDEPKFRRVFFRWAYYWDNIGTIVKLGYVPIKFAAASGACARTTLEAWEGFRDVVYRLRERGQKTKRDFDMWEYLYDELVKYLEEHPELEL